MERRVGRPTKGNNRRTGVMIYVDLEILEKVDKIVAHLKIENDKATSRSELYHQAMSKWLAR